MTYHVRLVSPPGQTEGLIGLLAARIRSDAVYAPSFYVLLAIAGLIGAVGILTNSQILIVGAMVVAPEYNAIMGVALGLDKRHKEPVLRGALALLAGTPVGDKPGDRPFSYCSTRPY